MRINTLLIIGILLIIYAISATGTIPLLDVNGPGDSKQQNRVKLELKQSPTIKLQKMTVWEYQQQKIQNQE